MIFVQALFITPSGAEVRINPRYGFICGLYGRRGAFVANLWLLAADAKSPRGCRGLWKPEPGWCGPGGHIEPKETPGVAFRREAKEEFGIDVGNITYLGNCKGKPEEILPVQRAAQGLEQVGQARDVHQQADVKRNLFIPEKYFEGSLEDFWKNIKDTDAGFEEKRQLLEAEGKRFRFVAKMENGACEVGLQAVDSHHPFYELEGSNNIIMISTERYHEYPMIIKGYGAGADVTAAGVFADIISIANIR